MDVQIATLIERAERYAQASKLSTSTVSLKIFDDGKRIGALKTGDVSCTIKRLNRAHSRLSELEDALAAKQATAAEA